MHYESTPSAPVLASIRTEEVSDNMLNSPNTAKDNINATVTYGKR